MSAVVLGASGFSSTPVDWQEHQPQELNPTVRVIAPVLPPHHHVVSSGWIWDLLPKSPLSSTSAYSLSQLGMLHRDWSNFGLPETCRELNTGNISPFLLTVSIGFYHQSWRSRSFPTWMSTWFFPKSIGSLFISREKKIFLDHTSHYFLENLINFWLTISLRLSTSHQLDSPSIASSIAIGLRIIQLMKYFGLW